MVLKCIWSRNVKFYFSLLTVRIFLVKFLNDSCLCYFNPRRFLIHLCLVCLKIKFVKLHHFSSLQNIEKSLSNNYWCLIFYWWEIRLTHSSGSVVEVPDLNKKYEVKLRINMKKSRDFLKDCLKTFLAGKLFTF